MGRCKGDKLSISGWLRLRAEKSLISCGFARLDLFTSTCFCLSWCVTASVFSGVNGFWLRSICILQRKDRQSIAITPCAAEHPMSFKVPDRLLTDGQCRMRINGVQFVQALLEANGLAAGKDYQFKGRYEAEKNAVIISLEKDEREW